jgi:DNA-binding transcriptional LysR family regulator
MRILDLTTFVVLAKHRHFGRTAQELNATQPAISARIAGLERELGCRLVERGEGSFLLTPEGFRALEAFTEIIGSVDRLRSDISPGNVDPVATIRIGAIDSVVSTWMPHLVESLREARPNLRIELSVEGTALLQKGMISGEFDLIFAVDPLVGEGFQSFMSCIMEMVWTGSDKVIDPKRLYTVDELAQLPIVTFPKGTPPFRQIAPYFHDERVLASKLVSSNSLFAIINLLIDGFGVGAIPAVTITREIDAGLLHPIRVAKPFPPLPIVGTYQTTVNRDLVRLVVEQSQASAAHYVERRNDNAIRTTADRIG